MRMNTSYRRLFRRSTAAGLGLLLVWVNLLVAEADVWVRRDWSKVQAVAPGTRTTVVLYKGQAPWGSRKIQGHFHSATAEAITLMLPGGQRHTLQKQAVCQVLVYRPFKKRYQGWITAAVMIAIIAGSAAAGSGEASEPLPGGVAALLIGAFVGGPTAVAFLLAPKWGGVYNVPPDRRDNSSTKTAPPNRRSSTMVPGVTETRRGPTGSGLADNFLTELSGPDLLRHQARQALVRKGLPLHLPDLPVHGLSAEQAGVQAGLDGGFPRVDGASRTDSLD